MVEDRRQFQRVGLDSPVPVLLDGSESSIVVDLCEDGLAVGALTGRKQGEILPFVFDLPEGGARIRGSAQIVWESSAAGRTGLRFVQLADAYRQQLVNFVSGHAWTMRFAGVEQEQQLTVPGAPVLINPLFADEKPAGKASTPPAETPNLFNQNFDPGSPLLATPETASSSNTERNVKLALVAVLLVVVVGSVIYVGLGMRPRRQARVDAAPAAAAPSPEPLMNEPASAAPSAPVQPVQPAAPAKPASAQPALSATPAPSAQPAVAKSAVAPNDKSPLFAAARLDVPGVVVQVGAMAHEENADALAKSLQQKNFPAFVYRRGGDAYYRVVVGPFNDRESPIKVQDALAKQRLKSFVRPWVPQ